MSRQALTTQSGPQAFTKVLCLYFLLMPTGAVALGTAGSLLRYFGLLPVLVFVLGREHKIAVLGPSIWQFSFILAAAVSVAWSIDKDDTLEGLYSQLMFFVLALAAGGYRFSAPELRMLRKSLVWASRASAVLLLAFGTTHSGRLWLTGIMTEDPNYLCGYFAFGIAESMIGILTPDLKTSRRAVSFGELLLYGYAIFLTGSRGGLIADACVVLAVYYFYRGRSSRRVFSARFILLLLVLCSMYLVMETLPETLAQRFTLETILEDRGTGRLDIWEHGIAVFSQSSVPRVIAGYGYHTIRDAFGLFGYPRKVMHNMFLQTLLENGVIGLILYTGWSFSYLKAALKKKDIFCIGVLLGMIVMSVSLSISAFKPYWNIMLYTLCVQLGYDPRPEGEEAA